ncbi:hypothetical protein V8C42DRAFT_348718 [Trichoderma barbatum]
MSKRNPHQVDNSLEFLCDLVKKSSISASDVAIITPYKANVELIARRRKDPAFSIPSTMPLAATVNSFQGREATIIAAIMATTQESGLLIFGDIKVMGEVAQNTEAKGKGKGKVLVGPHGAKSFPSKRNAKQHSK